MVSKSILSRNAKVFDDMLKTMQLSRKRKGLKRLSKTRLTELIAKKLKRKENLIYEKLTKI